MSRPWSEANNGFLGRKCGALSHSERRAEHKESEGGMVAGFGERGLLQQLQSFFIRLGAGYRCIRKRPEGKPSPQLYAYKTEKLQELVKQEKDGLINLYYGDETLPECFPAFNWCKSMGEGWYIPSLKELEEFVNFWLGNTEEPEWDDDLETEKRIDYSKQFFKDINNKMLEAGGIPFINGVYTSTTTVGGEVYIFNYDRAKNVWAFKKRHRGQLSSDCVGRAFIKF